MNCLGLDIGSTSIKGAILDLENGNVHSIVQRPFPSPIGGLPKGHFEIEPGAVVLAVEEVISSLLNEAPQAEALFCTGQMGGLLLLDSAGQPLTNYLSWRDQRTQQPYGTHASYLDAIRSRWRNSELADLGNELQAGSASSLLFWLNENQLLPPNVIPTTISDYVLGRLCQVPPAIHPTQAIGMLNFRTGTWHYPAFSALGLDRLRWPELVDQRQQIGKMSIKGQSLACYASCGDQQCALQGIGLTPAELSLNISTGSQVSRRTNHFQPGSYQTRSYFDGDFLNTITHLAAGRSLNVLGDLLTELGRAQGAPPTNPWPYIAEQAATADGGGLELDLAFFAGPLGNRGSVTGITTDNLNIGNLFHAAFRNMADNYYRCAERLSPDLAGLTLAISGGMTRSIPILRHLIEKRFQLSVRESTATEETLLGLLAIARDVCG